MSFGLNKEEITSLLTAPLYRVAAINHFGDGLDPSARAQVTNAIAEAITQNNARILEALNKAGIKIKED